MLLAMGINSRFRQFNDYFKYVLRHDDLMTCRTWEFMRFHYNKLVDLIRFVDNKITVLIFLSIFHNVFVLGVKVFDGIKSTRINALDHIYFWFFVATMMSRIGGVLMTCAQLNSAAMKPLELISKVPSKYWTLDVRLFSIFILSLSIFLFSVKNSLRHH